MYNYVMQSSEKSRLGKLFSAYDHDSTVCVWKNGNSTKSKPFFEINLRKSSWWISDFGNCERKTIELLLDNKKREWLFMPKVLTARVHVYELILEQRKIEIGRDVTFKLTRLTRRERVKAILSGISFEWFQTFHARNGDCKREPDAFLMSF